MLNSGCINTQNEDEQIISMLKEFYIAHNMIWETKPSLPPSTFDNKLDSLQQTYCTSRLRLESKKYLELGYDLLTNDFGASSENLNSTLTIIKDTTKENRYVVSYLTEVKTLSASRKEENIIHLTVINEEGSYKIDKVW